MTPARANLSHSQRTIGVLPVPPTARLPTLMTLAPGRQLRSRFTARSKAMPARHSQVSGINMTGGTGRGSAAS